MALRAITSSTAEQAAPLYDEIPLLLCEQDRWLLWERDGSGKKVPRSVRRPDRDCDGTKPSNWCDWATLFASPRKHRIGFALGRVEKGPTFSGIDLDDCVNPVTGVIDPWAWEIIRYINSYAEFSPSGTGVKVFTLGGLADDLKQGKVFKSEIYDRKRYFAVTGHHVPGTPRTVEYRENELRALHARQQSRDLLTLVKMFGLHIQDRGDWIDITCPWAEDHSGEDGPRDAALYLKDGKVSGFNCFHASHAETKSLPDVLKRFGLPSSSSDFVSNDRGTIPNHQGNIRKALEKLGVSLKHNLFTGMLEVTSSVQNHTAPLDDAVVTRAWLLVQENYGFLPAKEFFTDVLQDTARKTPYHPVRDYLDALKWDGQKRLDHWLATYGKAKNTKFNRAVSAIVLIAAVRRVRQPGCKFDELLVLISGKQGTDKSTTLRVLCPREDWFSDDLPLNVDTKQIIERTGGKWIIEIPELNGFSKRDIDHLKASLSRQVDGPVRLAYGRLPTQVPRQYVPIGTTNIHRFLKDPTGNRRFWPVEIEKFDIAALRLVVDQLWAEAAHREASGESIRLDQSLWSKAAQEQEARQVDDPWTPVLREFLGFEPDVDPDRPSFIPAEVRDRVLLDDIWGAVGMVDVNRREPKHEDRLNAVMQSLGYEKKQARGLTPPDTKSTKRWCLSAPLEGEADA